MPYGGRIASAARRTRLRTAKAPRTIGVGGIRRARATAAFFQVVRFGESGPRVRTYPSRGRVPLALDQQDHALLGDRGAFGEMEGNMRCRIRSLVAIATVGALALGLGLLPADGAGLRSRDRAYYILPPGNYGGLPFTDESTDQLALYDGLTPLRGDVSDADIEDHFLPENFEPVGQTVEEPTGRPGLQILYDEYGVETSLEPLPYECSAWLEGDRKSFQLGARTAVVQDARGRSLVLFPSEWDKRQAMKRNPEHRLLDVA